MSTDSDRTARSTRLLRTANQRALLEHAFSVGSFSASDAISATGLTRATVLAVAEDLLSAGWLREGTGAADGRRGRPARAFALREDAGTVAGFDAGAHTVRAQLRDLRGQPLSAVEVTLADGETANERVRLRALTDALHAACDEADVPRERLLAAAVGVPAPVDAHGQSPRGDSDFWDRMNPGPRAIASTLGGPQRLVIENDANLAALAEQEEHPGDDVVTLLSGERLGAGLIVDGRLLRGAAGGAGEMRFLDALVEPGHGADGIGVLARRLAERALAAAGPSATVLGGLEELEAADVFAAAAEGDAVAGHVLETIAQRIARVALTIASLLGVGRVVLAGAVAEVAGPLRARVQRELESLTEPPHPVVGLSRHGRDAVVVGAAAAALAAVREDPLGVRVELA